MLQLVFVVSCSASKAAPKKDITIDKTSSVFKPIVPEKQLSSMNIIDRNGLSDAAGDNIRIISGR